MSIRKYILYGVFLIRVVPLVAQNVINTYDFAGLSQSLRNNPAYDMQCDYHVDIPFTQLSADAGSSGVHLWDVFADNSVSIDTKLKQAIYSMSRKDIFLLNQKDALISMGYKINDKLYLSFGWYEELDLYSNFPKSMFQLYYEGTTQLGKQYSIDHFAMQTDLVGVYHIGIQKKINDKTNIGLRFKLYSGAFNLKTHPNTGYFETREGTVNTYSISVQDLDSGLQTSGVVYDNYDSIDRNTILKKLLLNGNKGLGIDLGFTYQYNDNLSFSGSILDLGMIFNTKDVTSYQAQGGYVTEGINLNFDPDHPMDYWQNLEDDFTNHIHYAVDNTSYVSWRPLKINAFVQYAFDKKRYASCTYDAQTHTDFKKNAVGALLQLQKRPETVLPAISIFYEKNFNNVLQTRLSYTADRLSQTNLGAVIAMHVWKVQLYAGINNILGFSNLAKANTASVQFGMSIQAKKN